MQDMHSLLKRQLKKFFGPAPDIPCEWTDFIRAVNAAYHEFDADRKMLERSLELTSQELLQANSEMRVMFQSIPDLLFTLDYSGKILDCKTGSSVDLYLSKEQLIGKMIENVPPQRVGNMFLEAIYEVQQKRELVSFEYSLSLHGQTNYYEARLMPLLENQIIAIVRNITAGKEAEQALRESEEKYRTLVENINVGIYRSTNDVLGYFMQANPAMVKIFGYSSIDEFLEINIAELCRDINDRKSFMQEIDRNGFVKNRELNMKKKDGSNIVVSCTAISHYDENGVKQWVDGVMEDITERKQRAAELLKTSKLESVGILAGGIAHDFNNILTAIIGNISLARTMVSPKSEASGRLTEAEKASLRAQDLTRQLLTFSKGGEPVKSVSSISELLRESAGFVLSGSNVSCEYEIAGDLMHADIDQGQISQVISNLVINAKQAMPGGGVIKIRAQNVFISEGAPEQGLPLKEGIYVKISIADAGPGIPDEQLDKIFDPYFTTKKSGSGLGLSTSYSIIKKHKGHIFAKNNPAGGAVFYIYLPASREPVTRKGQEVVERIQGRGKLLIMDDEETVRSVLERMLNHFGFEVTKTTDGAEAIEILREAYKSGKRFDAVIMDLTIPGGMGGREAAALIREIDSEVKIIASSGYSNDPIMSEYRKYGFSAIMAKPFTLNDVREVLRQTLPGEINFRKY
jgi:two-component system, cell cycle sensor histidine kinase and response regulator CckA